ncbi:restriction endonuclease [Micromonospora sp. DR5-3]|uniref:restriction endonuclease n=1 Tax=unclassified Micromonospora TaxID=2617518 RepID=UPI001CA36F63|nr:MULTISPECIES: restriction endonuclease [unclassified Micromonospora]MCW3817864.1 restriction endonuclease [Micromonospora sp. DR5-3]
MAIPDFQSFMRPVLNAHADQKPHAVAEIREAVATALAITDEDRKVMLPSGREPRYLNRIAWAITHVAQAGLLNRPARGVTEITERGKEVLRAHPERVDIKILMGFPEYVEFRTRTRVRQPGAALQEQGEEVNVETLAPREAIEELIEAAHSAVAAELLSRVVSQPPEFLEQLVLRLLVAMGYGGLERMIEHIGGPGDGGLDGLVRLDPLGLDVVYVQAKRYTDRPVGRPDIQASVGALQGAQANRGIFITTSRFSADARDYADRVNSRLILIDGPELARLMIVHGCGVVTEETYILKQIDENFFSEA